MRNHQRFILFSAQSKRSLNKEFVMKNFVSFHHEKTRNVPVVVLYGKYLRRMTIPVNDISPLMNAETFFLECG